MRVVIELYRDTIQRSKHCWQRALLGRTKMIIEVLVAIWVVHILIAMVGE
jgi:hypothetical protein